MSETPRVLSPMITDARALRPQYIPREIHHRDGKIDALTASLRPAESGLRPEDCCIYGPSGTGKTTLAKYVLSQLVRQALDVRWGYVNCMAEPSRTGALYELLRNADLGASLPRDGTSTGVFLDCLRDYDGTFIAVLDEVDVLEEPNLVLSLTDVPTVSVVPICVQEDELIANLDNRLASRLRQSNSINLDFYSHSQLVDIIDYRVEAGLISHRVDPEAVQTIADLAAGDARVAIALLRRGAKYVIENDVKDLSAEIVEQVTEEAHIEVREFNVRNLGTHQRLLYEIIKEDGDIQAGTLHDRYQERVQDPKTRRTRRRYLDSLRRYDLIQVDGDGRGTTYSIVSP
jgi:Cdc6-like AAA superfamily ATPase